MKTTINFRVEHEVKEQLEFLAEADGITISEVVRDIIIHNLTERGLLAQKPSQVIYLDLSQIDFTNITSDKNNLDHE
ncbi:MAG TPA: hypothetical protein EYO76_09255 [Flavobacteriaceae bacterium]|nr:hypothetical protein [Flavobacteriaceae bacterium]